MPVPPSIKPLAYSTEPLKAALAEYDRGAPERQRLWDSVQDVADVAAAEAADALALRKVCDAFYEVTQDRNSREDCRRLPLDFMRRIAALN